MNKDTIHSNLVFNIAYQVVTVLSPLIVTPKISRVFGADYIGVKSYSFTLVYYFAIIGVLGFDLYGQRIIAIVKDNAEERNRSFSTIYYTRFSLVLLSTITYVIFISVIDAQSYVERIVSWCWLLYLVREMINPNWFLQGMERFRLLSIFGIISQVLYVIVTLVFVRTKDDLPLYILIYTAIPLLISLLYFPVVFRYAKFVKISTREMLIAARESVVYFIPTVATAIYSMVDKTMLGVFDQTRVSVGLYECAEKLVKVALAFCTASFTIMRTRMSYLYGKKDKENYKQTSKKFISFSMMLCWPIMFGIIAISKHFVPVFFGPGYEEVIVLSYVFSAVIPCLTISGLLQAIYIFPYGLQKSMGYYYGIIVIVNIIMNLVLINAIGTLGAIIASITAELTLATILFIKARKEIDVSYIITGSIKYMVSAIVMMTVMLFMEKLINGNPVVLLLIEFITGVATYFLTCIICLDSFVTAQTKRIIMNTREIFHR